MLTLKCNNFGHLQEKVNDAITKINSQGDSSKFLKNLQKTLFFHNTSQFGLTKIQFGLFFFDGRDGKIRTCDLRYPKPSRYQAALRPDTAVSI